MLGTGFDARAASGAEVGRDCRTEVGHLDRALRARFLALFAANAARGTQLAGQSALVVIGAAHDSHLLFGHDLDDAPGTRLDAQGAGAALVLVDDRDAVADADRLIGARRLTIA